MASYQDTVLADSPVGYWRFQEGSGATCADTSGNGQTGTANGTFTRNVATNHAGLGVGITLGGTTSDYVSVVKTAGLNITGNVTYECWLNATSFAAGGNVMICAGATAVGAQGYQMYVFGGATGDIRLASTWSNSTIVGTGTGPLNTGTLYHIVCTYVNQGAAVIYVNGAQATSGSSTVQVTTNTEPFTIGVQSINGTRAAAFVGLLDEVAVYATALSAARVLAHYNARDSAGGGTNAGGSVGGIIATQAVTQSFVSQIAPHLAPGRPVEKGPPPGQIKRQPPPPPPPSPAPQRLPGTEFPPES